MKLLVILIFAQKQFFLKFFFCKNFEKFSKVAISDLISFEINLTNFIETRCKEKQSILPVILAHYVCFITLTKLSK